MPDGLVSCESIQHLLYIVLRVFIMTIYSRLLYYFFPDITTLPKTIDFNTRKDLKSFFSMDL